MSRLRQASAVILTRETSHGLQVYLVERSPKLRFFGGYWAMPGGVLDDADQRPDAPEVEAFQRAAIRELFEETGVLPPTVRDQRDEAWCLAMRRALLETPSSDNAENQSWAHVEFDPGWMEDVLELTTPEFAPVRYRTRFLHAKLPPGQEPTIEVGELVGGGFFDPRAALEKWRAGDLLIVPPVLFLLEVLADPKVRDWQAFLAAARNHAAQLRAGRLHPVYFNPGILLAPLRTPTLPPATTTNCLLVGEQQVYIVDPASGEGGEQQRLFQILDEWQAQGRELKGILVTHHHADHVGAVVPTSQRYQMPVLAHPRTLERLPPGAASLREVEDGDRLDLGTAPDGTSPWFLQAFHTPGHDQGHLAFVESRYRSAIVGDLVSTVSTIVIDPPEGHLATYLESLQRMLGESIETLYPAHGPAVRDGSGVLRRYLEHRQQREDALLQALTPEPQTIEQLVAPVYSDVPKDLHALASRSLRAGLDKLQEEGKARQEGDLWRQSF